MTVRLNNQREVYIVTHVLVCVPVKRVQSLEICVRLPFLYVSLSKWDRSSMSECTRVIRGDPWAFHCVYKDFIGTLDLRFTVQMLAYPFQPTKGFLCLSIKPQPTLFFLSLPLPPTHSMRIFYFTRTFSVQVPCSDAAEYNEPGMRG